MKRTIGDYTRDCLKMSTSRRPVHLCGRRLDSTAHVCAFYDSDDEHYAAVLPYLAEGLANGEHVVNIYDKADHPRHHARMASARIPVEAAAATGQFELLSPEETYLTGGSFKVQAMLRRVRSLLEEGQASSYPYLRTCGDMGWAMRALSTPALLMEYEARLGFLIHQHECTLLCAYDTRKFSRATFMDILRTHPQVLIGDTIVDNEYYVSPLEYLRELEEKSSKPVAPKAGGICNELGFAT